VSTLVKHARNLSVQASEAAAGPSTRAAEDAEAHPDRPESLPADIVKEARNVLSRFRSDAAKRFKDIEKAEDAADEALLKFGTNIRNFLADAVSIAPPESGSENEKNGTVLFESKDSSGKKVVHATRFDAQLHVIHSSLDSFLKDPASAEWEKWRTGFDVDSKTDAIAKDLDKNAELRAAMEKCVPEKVDYATFWGRYYFLRHVVESEEQRRRDMLKGEYNGSRLPKNPSNLGTASTPADDEEVAWDEDSEEEEEDDDDDDEDDDDEEDDDDDEDDDEDDEDDDDDDDDSSSEHPLNKSATNLAASVKTLKPATEDIPKPAPKPTAAANLRPAQPRRSNDEKSVADSDASYDLVSGTTSRAPGSPQQEKKKPVAEEEESDEEDWE
jgi:hypothetical protein